MTLRALGTTCLALAMALGLGACDNDPMVKSWIPPNDGVQERIRAAADDATGAKAASAMAAAAPAPTAGSAPPPPAPSAAAPAAAPQASAPVQVASAEPAAPAAGAGYSAADGKAPYAIYCASCHGSAGAGDGPAAAAMNPKPANHTDGAYMNGLSNDHLYKVVDEGGMAVGKSPLMTPWGSVLSEDQIWQMVAFMRSIAQPPYTGAMP